MHVLVVEGVIRFRRISGIRLRPPQPYGVRVQLIDEMREYLIPNWIEFALGHDVAANHAEPESFPLLASRLSGCHGDWIRSDVGHSASSKAEYSANDQIRGILHGGDATLAQMMKYDLSTQVTRSASVQLDPNPGSRQDNGLCCVMILSFSTTWCGMQTY